MQRVSACQPNTVDRRARGPHVSPAGPNRTRADRPRAARAQIGHSSGRARAPLGQSGPIATHRTKAFPGDSREVSWRTPCAPRCSTLGLARAPPAGPPSACLSLRSPCRPARRSRGTPAGPSPGRPRAASRPPTAGAVPAAWRPPTGPPGPPAHAATAQLARDEALVRRTRAAKRATKAPTASAPAFRPERHGRGCPLAGARTDESQLPRAASQMMAKGPSAISRARAHPSTNARDLRRRTARSAPVTTAAGGPMSNTGQAGRHAAHAWSRADPERIWIPSSPTQYW